LLGIARDGQFVASFDRPNLFLRVELREKGLVQTLSFLERYRGESGIIYCATRKQVDELAADLKANGWPALPYHAGLEDALRRENQNRFTNDEVRLMVATIAFGMGINKPNVRFVLHYNLPKDLESYYQEIGRAGRDGLRSECLLLYSRGDATKIRHFIFQGAAKEIAGREERLQGMMRFAETQKCRRVALLEYFGESFKGSCGACDHCAPVTVHHQTVRSILSVAKRRFHEIGGLYASGQSLNAIAARFGVRTKTVTENLSRFQEAGGKIDAARLLRECSLAEPDRRSAIQAFQRFGLERLAPVHQALNGRVPYSELHVLRLYLRACQ
jgi:ATP-dependent DNA helicase RecQ